MCYYSDCDRGADFDEYFAIKERSLGKGKAKTAEAGVRTTERRLLGRSGIRFGLSQIIVESYCKDIFFIGFVFAVVFPLLRHFCLP